MVDFDENMNILMVDFDEDELVHIGNEYDEEVDIVDDELVLMYDGIQQVDEDHII